MHYFLMKLRIRDAISSRKAMDNYEKLHRRRTSLPSKPSTNCRGTSRPVDLVSKTKTSGSRGLKREDSLPSLHQPHTAVYHSTSPTNLPTCSTDLPLLINVDAYVHSCTKEEKKKMMMGMRVSLVVEPVAFFLAQYSGCYFRCRQCRPPCHQHHQPPRRCPSHDPRRTQRRSHRPRRRQRCRSR